MSKPQRLAKYCSHLKGRKIEHQTRHVKCKLSEHEYQLKHAELLLSWHNITCVTAKNIDMARFSAKDSTLRPLFKKPSFRQLLPHCLEGTWNFIWTEERITSVDLRRYPTRMTFWKYWASHNTPKTCQTKFQIDLSQISQKLYITCLINPQINNGVWPSLLKNQKHLYCLSSFVNTQKHKKGANKEIKHQNCWPHNAFNKIQISANKYLIRFVSYHSDKYCEGINVAHSGWITILHRLHSIHRTSRLTSRKLLNINNSKVFRE
jgi:hypothetical protein